MAGILDISPQWQKGIGILGASLQDTGAALDGRPSGYLNSFNRNSMLQDSEQRRQGTIKKVQEAYARGDMNAVRAAAMEDPEFGASLMGLLKQDQPKFQEVGGALYRLPTTAEGAPERVVDAPRKPLEAPKSRTFRQGGVDITQEFQPDGTWKELGRGAAWKPDAPTGSDGDVSGLSEGALVNAAVRYNSTGLLPPLGAGRASAGVKQQILDRAALLATGKTTPEQLVSNAAEYSANKSSLATQTKQFNAIETAANAAKNSAQLGLKFAREGGAGPTGMPIFDRWVQAGRKATGDKNVVNLTNHLDTFAEEYAKVMTGATGAGAATDSARQAAHDRINAAYSLPMLESVIGEMSKEMGGRHYAARAQIDNIKSQLRGEPYSEPHGVQEEAPITAGNINLHNRPKVQNADGSYSTVRSITITDDNGRAILIPTVVGNRVVSNPDAIAEYKRTGKHLGIFRDEASADRYAQSLHDDQAREYGSSPGKAKNPVDKLPRKQPQSRVIKYDAQGNRL